MSNRNKKLAIFKRFADNFKIVAANPYYNWEAPLPEIAYLCPICFNFFNKCSSNQEGQNYLTFEHLPPKKLGGKPDILTCRNCNGLHSLNDRELSREVKLLSFLRNDVGSKLRDIDIQAGDKRFRTTIEKEADSKLKFTLKNQTELLQLVELINNEKDFKFGGDKADPRSVQLAILKSAYLLAFKKFGYGYILHSSFNPIREQLLNPNTEVLPSLGVLFGNNSKGIFVVTNPIHARSLYINFELKISSGSFFAGALIPTPSTNVIDFYQQIKPMTEGKSQITLINIHNQKYLSDKHSVFYHFDLKQYFKDS